MSAVDLETSSTPLTCANIKPHSPGYGCSLCNHVFGTLSEFDKHQTRNYPSPTTCQRPESLGLSPDHLGIWRTPAAIANNQRLAHQIAPPVHARTSTNTQALFQEIPQ